MSRHFRSFMPHRRRADRLPKLSPQNTMVFAGSITPSAPNPTLLTKKPLAGAVTPAGAVVRLVSKPLAGSITPAGALVKRTNKPLAGSVTPAGALTKRTSKTFTGAITPAGALAKLLAKAFTGSVDSTGALAKLATKALAGGITPAGDLVVPHQLILLGAPLTPIPQVDLGPETETSAEARRANRLEQHFTQLYRQPNIWWLLDGTFTEDQPWSLDLVRKVYYGGHLNVVTEAERVALVAAGYTVTNVPGA